MESKIKVLIVLIIGMFLIGGVGAVKPTQQGADVFSEGYDIEFTGIDVYENKQDIHFTNHVFNISNGLELDNTKINCTFDLYDNKGIHLLNEIPMNWNLTGNDFEYIVTGGNFTRNGQYCHMIHCNSSDFGGFEESCFDVTYSGIQLSEAQGKMYLPLFLVLLFLFGVTAFGIHLLPSANERDEEEKLMSISYLKYLRTPLWLVLWGFFIAILFISSNIALVYLPDSLIHSFFFVIFQVALGLTLPIIIVTFYWILVKVTEDKKLKEYMRRGLTGNKAI